MANHRSAIKRARQNDARKAHNRSLRTAMRTQIKKLRQTIAGDDKAAAQDVLRATVSLIDKTAKRGIIKDNTAARYKARLSKRVNEATGKGRN